MCNRRQVYPRPSAADIDLAKVICTNVQVETLFSGADLLFQDPDLDYIQQAEIILGKLKLNDIFEKVKLQEEIRLKELESCNNVENADEARNKNTESFNEQGERSKRRNAVENAEPLKYGECLKWPTEKTCDQPELSRCLVKGISKEPNKSSSIDFDLVERIENSIKDQESQKNVPSKSNLQRRNNLQKLFELDIQDEDDGNGVKGHFHQADKVNVSTPLNNRSVNIGTPAFLNSLTPTLGDLPTPKIRNKDPPMMATPPVVNDIFGTQEEIDEFDETLCDEANDDTIRITTAERKKKENNCKIPTWKNLTSPRVLPNQNKLDDFKTRSCELPGSNLERNERILENEVFEEQLLSEDPLLIGKNTNVNSSNEKQLISQPQQSCVVRKRSLETENRIENNGTAKKQKTFLRNKSPPNNDSILPREAFTLQTPESIGITEKENQAKDKLKRFKFRKSS